MDFTGHFAQLETITNNPNQEKVNKKDYEIFCREFIFDKIKGESFGKAFCNRFGFNSFFIDRLDDANAKYLIEKLGYIE